MESEIDKCLNKSRKELENIFLTALRKVVPKCFEIDYSKGEILGLCIRQFIEVSMTRLACKFTVSSDMIYNSPIDISRYALDYLVYEFTAYDINCYFIIGNHKPTLYISSPTILIEDSMFLPTVDICLRTQAAIVIFAESLDKIPVSNKLKAIVELESNGYYKTKMSIKEAERLCYEIASNR